MTYSQGAGSANGDLLFTKYSIDYPSGDYTLRPTSQAINLGTDLSKLFTTDFTGAARTAPWSSGAIEYIGAVPGDINNDLAVSLDDTITALLVATGATPPSVNVDADVNGDGCIGVEDAIAVLQIIAAQQ